MTDCTVEASQSAPRSLAFSCRTLGCDKFKIMKIAADTLDESDDDDSEDDSDEEEKKPATAPAVKRQRSK